VFSLLLRFAVSVYTFVFSVLLRFTASVYNFVFSLLLRFTVSVHLFTENMAMTGTNCLKLLIFQSVSMTMVYGFSGSDFETVSSNFVFSLLLRFTVSVHNFVFSLLRFTVSVYAFVFSLLLRLTVSVYTFVFSLLLRLTAWYMDSVGLISRPLALVYLKISYGILLVCLS
jgi:hypothetical protein